MKKALQVPCLTRDKVTDPGKLKSVSDKLCTFGILGLSNLSHSYPFSLFGLLTFSSYAASLSLSLPLSLPLSLSLSLSLSLPLSLSVWLRSTRMRHKVAVTLLRPTMQQKHVTVTMGKDTYSSQGQEIYGQRQKQQLYCIERLQSITDLVTAAATALPGRIGVSQYGRFTLLGCPQLGRR